MIAHPALLGGLFLGLILLIQRAAVRPALRWAFAVTPVPFWCYVLPMLGTAAGAWPAQSPLYGWCSTQLLPVCLGLLLLGTDVRGILRLGGQAVGLMLIGSGSVVLGIVIAWRLWHPWLPADGWQGLSALAGSWTGGSMNLLAVKEALGMSDAAIAPIILTDTIVAYGWMALLLMLSTAPGATRPAPLVSPQRGETSLREDRGCSRPDGRTMPATRDLELPGRVAPARLFATLAIAILMSWGAQCVARRLPIGVAVNAATWTVLLVTTVALALSLTPLGRLGRGEAVERLGMVCLLVLLASIGARADLRAARSAPVFLVAGVTAVAIHGAVLAVVGWRWRAPLGLLATVSQANVGGVVSAPLVASAYDRALAPVGLLMAVLGNAVGTYLGLTAAILCRAVVAGR